MKAHALSRRQFLGAAATAPFLARYHHLAATERKRVKILGAPTSTLLGGAFRQKVRIYDHEAPRNMLDKASCREWAQKVKADPAGFTAHKFGFPHTKPDSDAGRDLSNKMLSTKELIQI